MLLISLAGKDDEASAQSEERKARCRGGRRRPAKKAREAANFVGGEG